MILIASILYGLIALASIRPITGHLAYSWLATNRVRYSNLYRNVNYPGGDLWFIASCMATLIAVVWPLAILYSRISLEKFAIGAEAQALAKQRQARIKEMEREVGL